MTTPPTGPAGPQDSPHWPPVPDRPTHPYAVPQDAAHVPMEQVWTVVSSLKRTGAWRVPAHLAVSVAMGDARLDLREAELSSPLTTIEVRGFMGDVKIIVPDRLRVECTGSAFVGEFEHKESGVTAAAPADSPLVRVIGGMLLGEVTVYRTAAAVGEGAFSVDGLAGVRARRRLRRLRRRGHPA